MSQRVTRQEMLRGDISLFSTEETGTDQSPGKTREENRREYPRETVTTFVDDTEVQLLSVYHWYPAWREHKDYFQTQIRDADASIIEGPKQVWNHGFYGPFTDEMREQNQHMYIADPRNGKLDLLDLGQTLSSLAAATIATGKIAANYKNEEMTRRDAFTLLGVTGVSAAVFGGTVTGSVIRDTAEEGEKYEYGLDHALLWGTQDFRDIRIADGIEAVCRETTHDKLLSVHGAAHTDPIHHYLENPTRRAAKKDMYDLHMFVTDDMVEEYAPREDVDELWEQVGEIPY